MGGLIYNEIAKIVAQRRFLVVVIILTLMSILSALSMRGFNGELGIKAAQVVSVAVSGGFAQLMFPFFIAVIVGDILAGELSAGTLKLLLIRPVSRWKIWLSKLIAAFLVSAAIVLYSGACVYVALGAASGFGSWSAPDSVVGSTASSGSVALQAYGLEMISLFSVVSIFMLIGTVVESGVAAVGLSAGLVMLCSIVVPIVHAVPHAWWLNYAFFEHWQLANHITGNFPVDNWTVKSSIAVLAAWSAFAIATGIALFQWRDVKS